MLVLGDVTVPSGGTLNIAAGTRVHVWPSDLAEMGADTTRVEFNVEGTLVADGTFTDPIVFDSWTPTTSEDWVGMYFDSLSGGGTFDHCEIAHAEYGVESWSHVTMSDCAIHDCEYAGLVGEGDSLTVTGSTVDGSGAWGVFLTSADAILTSDVVKNCESAGVQVQPNASLVAAGCTMRDNDTGVYINDTADVTLNSACVLNNNGIGVHCYSTNSPAPTIAACTVDSNETGIYCEYYSHPYIDQNTMEYNGAAIYCIDHSSPLVTSNVILHNTNGVLAAENANPSIGQRSSASANTIYAKTNYEVVNFTEGLTLGGEDNWWNSSSGPVPARILGSVDYDPWLTEAPALMFSLPVKPEHVPTKFALGAVVPNPFNPQTTIHYDVPLPGGKVTIRIYDVAGRLVSELVNAFTAPGFHEVRWNGVGSRGGSVASGVYFVQMKSPTFVQSKKLVLLK